MAEAVGIPLRHHHDGLPGPRGIFVSGRGIPARIRQVIFRVRRALGRGEAQKLRGRELSLGGLLLERCVFGKGFRADVGGVELRVPLFKTEVRGALVAKKHVAVADKELVDTDHGGFGLLLVALNPGRGNRIAKTVRFKKGRDPLEAPLQRAHHAVFVARGQPRLPGIHPARVPVSQHESELILSARSVRRWNTARGYDEAMNQPEGAYPHQPREQAGEQALAGGGSRVAFFGGSFDPPHLGHLAVARAARAAFRLDTVLFAPVGAQPLKPEGSAASFEQRLAMTRLAIAGEPGFEVSLADAPKLSREHSFAPNYTIDTLEGLRAGLAPECALFCLMGADTFFGLHRWRRAAEIPFVAPLIVASRPGQRPGKWRD